MSYDELVSGVDTAWLRMDSPTNLMIINAMIVIDRVDFDTFAKTIRQRLLRYPRFHQKPVWHSGLFYWVEDQFFDLDCHLHRVALPGAADKSALQKYLSDQLCVPFDSNKPLWQMHFIENYQDGAAVIMRVHHCYADGIALVKLFHGITDAEPHPKKLKAVQPAADTVGAGEPLYAAHYPWPFYQHFVDAAVHTLERYGHWGQRLSEEGLHVLRDPEMLRHYLKDGVRAVSEVAKIALMPSDPKTCLKRTLGVKKVCAWSEKIPLALFKEISDTLGCKINDLLLSCVAGALRQEMLLAGDDLAVRKIHVTVPVNIRALQLEDNDVSLGNCFGTVFVPLPVGIDNPIERVYTVKHDMQTLKASLQPGVSFALLYATGLLPRHLQKPIMEMFCKKSSAVLSNVPGTREVRYLAGAKIREQMFWVPQTADIGLGLSIISYAGHVQFGMVGDARLFSDPERVIRHCVDELERHRPEHLFHRVEPVDTEKAVKRY